MRSSYRGKMDRNLTNFAGQLMEVKRVTRVLRIFRIIGVLSLPAVGYTVGMGGVPLRIGLMYVQPGDWRWSGVVDNDAPDTGELPVELVTVTPPPPPTPPPTPPPAPPPFTTPPDTFVGDILLTTEGALLPPPPPPAVGPFDDFPDFEPDDPLLPADCW